MREPSSPGNPPSKLPEKLDQRLNMYALAAAAACSAPRGVNSGSSMPGSTRVALKCRLK